MKKSTIFLFLVILGAGLFACSESDGPQSLSEIREEGQLRFASRDFATSIYRDQNGDRQGLEFDLIQSFSSHLGVRPKIIMRESVDEVLLSLEAQSADIAAAALTQTEDRADQFIVPRHYETVEEEVVCQSKIKVKKVQDLILFSVVVENNSSYVERLQALKEDYPKLEWKTVDESSEEILRKIDDNKYECTLIDSNLFKIFRRYYPSARKQISLPGEQKIGWLIAKDRRFLRKEVDRWIDRITVSGELERLLDKHYGYSDRFDPYDLQKFRERIETRLPKYQKLFEQAADEYDFDWKLLAALSYQESHWDPMATSPTGVAGLMMLTQRTAKSLGVKDRRDPKESIFGGAQYLRSRIQRVPRYVPQSDQLWFALAAYNVGYGHLTDARAIAVLLNLNPNRWLDVRTALPKLSNQKYNRYTRYGYARGIEPVLYVKRIRDYYNILQRELKK